MKGILFADVRYGVLLLPLANAEAGRGGAVRKAPGLGKGSGIESNFDAGSLCFGARGGGGWPDVNVGDRVGILAWR